ncbi:MAG TPA: hypothetical protein PLS69_15560, partial [Terricaulis sp.]|nr:hypothetical protein [Terricaulis sp.]HRP10534.1 hypothetical protein [Terricaulis sp.]
HVNDLFAETSEFSVRQKTPEKSEDCPRTQTRAQSALTFEDRNEATLTIRLTGFKPSRECPQQAAGRMDMAANALISRL